MSNYTKSTNFATKDTLTSGDPLKIVKGTEINTEFDNIQTAVNSKSDTASPTFTGTVTIPSLSLSGLTVSSAVATNASNALVSVTNTGTGNNVLATSPTLVTPILGTPQSGTLTNATGLPLTTGVTGVLPEANGGTGSSAGNAMFKNRIINGAMVIDQRNAGASVTPTTGQYLVDRFQVILTQASKFTAQQNAGAVTPPAGFIKYQGITSSSAYSVLAADYFVLRQTIEGLNTADLAWGTASAATVTLSFWVRSSLTGTFGGSLQNDSSNRSYPFTYTISAANTWEQKSVTIAGDTSGTWLTTNAGGISLGFGLGVGSTFSGTAGAWAASNFLSATGATSVVGTSSATFYITGVQLEKGSTATSFDYRPYGTELALCQRYYYRVGPSLGNDVNLPFSGFASSTTIALLTVPFLVTMRTAPSALEQSGTAADYAIRYAGGSIANCSAVPTFQSGQIFGAQVGLTVASGLTAGGAIGGRSGSATGNNSYFGWSAEL